MSDSLNVQIARALGWTGIKSVTRGGVEEWWGIRPGGVFDERLPDCEHSLDACAAALPDGYALTLHATKAVTIQNGARPFDEVHWFADEGDWESSAALALLAWATAQQAAGA
jgi:hypothetical protein